MAQTSQTLFVAADSFCSGSCHLENGSQDKAQDLYNNIAAQLQAKKRAYITECIKERYKLMAYWHCFEDHCKTGLPVLRPVGLEQANGSEATTDAHDGSDRFMMGDGLLVVPIDEASGSSVQKALKGLEGRWYDYYTKKEMSGDEEIKAGLEKIGCFFKGGNIVPTYDIRTYVESSKEAKESNINLYIALDDNQTAKGNMYFDDGKTCNHKPGAIARKNIEFTDNTLIWKSDDVATSEVSNYVPHNRVTRAVIMGLDSSVKDAYLVEEGKTRQKLHLVKKSGHLVVEFVAVASKNWKIVLE